MRYIVVILFLLSFDGILCQDSNTVFKPISLDQGHINDIMRDSEGFIWISTQDGLTKYNGNKFIQYNYDRKNVHSIAHNYVWCTFEDNRQNIWVGLFGGGLCRLDKVKNKFFRYDDFRDIADHGIRTLRQLDDSTLVVGTDYGLHLFNLNQDRFYTDTTFLRRQFEAGLFHSHSMEIEGEDILIAGENGGYILTPYSRQVKKMDVSISKSSEIKFLKRLSNGRYFISNLKEFLELEYLKNQKDFKVVRSLKKPFQIGVNDVSEDQNGRLLLASEEGLYKISFEDKRIDPIPHNRPEINKLEDKVAYCIEVIEQNIKWIGTKTHIYEFDQRKSAFQHILNEKLCGSAILGIREDDSGNLWVGTRRGLSRIKHFNQPQKEWEYQCFDRSSNPEMRNDYILNIGVFEDRILVGYRQKGFAIVNINKDDRISFLEPPEVVDRLTRTGSVSNFHLDVDGEIWISTSGNGVVKWNPNSNEAIQYKNTDGKPKVVSHNYLFGFEEVDENWMAVASAGGISMIHKKVDSTYQIYGGSDSLQMSGNFVMDFHRDKKNQLWVCTDGGINLWKEDNTFRSWTKNEGLPNDVVYGMLESGDELWISSNRGLTRIQNESSPKFKTFSIEDDILNEEHNQFSFYKSTKGEFYFGGKSGITFFDPSNISSNSQDAKTVIEDFFLFNENGASRLNTHINYTDELVLNHNENFLSFDLASLSYFKSDQNKYRYQLMPLNDAWIDMYERSFFSLSGLAPGKYNLAIQSSNNDGIWGSETKNINIIIRHPIYARWYAWLLYFLVLTGLIYAYYKMKLNHITHVTRAREEERTKIRERSARDFHDEVGALVTKLSLLNQYLLSDTPVEQKENIRTLNKMQSNIQRIRLGMKDFIWVLDPNKDSLNSTIIKIKEIGNDLFEHADIKFQCQAGINVDQNLELNGVQRRQLILLIKEALHNVVKHSDAKNCHIEISQSGQYLEFVVRDDGRGFITENKSNGYGLKSMRQRARKMKANVTINSAINMGTKILIQIPTHPNGL